ncbi:MAG: hypothetical protein AB8F94_27055 [Saprospiraceae bacterium]
MKKGTLLILAVLFFTNGLSAQSHYVIDPTDGSAMLVNFMLSPDIDKDALKKYNSDLKSTKLSLRD